MKNKRILITGFAGSIGSELTRQLCAKNKVFGVDINESESFLLTDKLQKQGRWVYFRTGDVRDSLVIADVFEDFKPQYVFHCAALKHVSPNEAYPLEAIKTNVLGTYNVMAEAKRWECLEKFVFISTDKAVNSTSIMGATKRLGEIMVKNQGKGFIVVRFGNVLGSRGSVIPIWEDQINSKQPITVTDESMERYTMTIEEACSLVIGATEIGKGGEIVVLDMGKKIKILDLAKRIAEELRGSVKVTGIRPGEQLTEHIMTLEEQTKAIKKDNYYII